MDSKFEEVKSVVMEVIHNTGEGITPETRIIEDLKADSMDQFFLIDGLSEKFNITITDEQAKSIKTIGDIVDLLK